MDDNHVAGRSNSLSLLESNADFADSSNLTRSQFLMWLGQKLQPDAPLYNMIQTFQIEGDLDPDLFSKAFHSVVMRSDAMRTVIVEEDGVPQKQIVGQITYALEYLDFSKLKDVDTAVQDWLGDRAQRTFRLDQRLFDSVLIRLGEKRFLWYLSQHHLITDGWSFYLVYKYTSDSYQMLAEGRAEEELPQIPAFAEYASFEREYRDTPAFAKAEAYWKDKLAVPSEPLSFYDHVQTQSSATTKRVVADLGQERSQQLRQIAGEKGIRGLNLDFTLFNLFATLFCAFLNRITGASEITIGTPSHNRPKPTFKETIGLFIEVSPMRVQINEEDTFLSLYKRVSEEAYAVLRNAQPGTSSAEHNRAYEVLLNFVNVSFPAFANMPVAVDWLHSGYGDSGHSLRLQIHDFNDEGNYSLSFDFNPSTFNEERQKWAVSHFLRVVDAFIENRSELIHQVALLSDGERQAYLLDFNRSSAEYPKDLTVVDLIESQAEKTPEAIALVFGNQQMTYRELTDRSNQLAWRLKSMGVGAEHLVAVCMEHSLETIVGLLGVLKAGGAYVPLDPAYPKARLEYMLEDITRASTGEAPVLLVQPWLVNAMPSTSARLLVLDNTWEQIATQSTENLPRQAAPNHLAYVIYTSGSTGKPKGVQIEHRGLTNYLWWARKRYFGNDKLDFAFFSSLSFDLTITSIYLPLISGSRVVIYREDQNAKGSVILRVVEDNQVEIVKLTPSHLALIKDMNLAATRIRKFIVGGEDFKTDLAREVDRAYNGLVDLYNEYGPTETVVGCMIHRFDPEQDMELSVPIGVPADNAQIYVLDRYLNPTPAGMVGEMYIGGDGVGRGYLNRADLTAQKFIDNPFKPGERMYRTGDLAKWMPNGKLAFLGRADHQVKIGGYRIELGEIETRLREFSDVREGIVEVVQIEYRTEDPDRSYCTRCGLASDYPGVSYDEAGVCNFCRAYDGYKAKAQQYFKTMNDLHRIINEQKSRKKGDYDCIVLLSGGKDSTYMLYQLVQMDLKVLAFTLDNGFISEGAKENIRTVVTSLGVDHIFGKTPVMNAVFVESLQQHANVCNGCFKTLYTLAVNLAREKGIPCIMTGLSRGQFFETRLTEDLFRGADFDTDAIDRSILAARKAYHRRNDLISRSLDVDFFRDDQVFSDVVFVDFYRYCDVGLAEVYTFLRERAPWIRPSDTGRSTNCLINDAGIYLHKKKRGYHNYALPYSWDVRMGHKTREDALAELNDDIDEENVQRILSEIGYQEPEAEQMSKRLVAYYVPQGEVSESELRAFLAQSLPDYMVPAYFIPLKEIPLTANGKVDRQALPKSGQERPALDTAFVSPSSPVEEQLAEIWSAILNVHPIGIHDNFFDLGGSSLPALQLAMRVNQAFGIELPVQQYFACATIQKLAQAIEEHILAEIEGLSEAEAQALLRTDE
jgi:amino acid adenylation domain-containing protein